MGSAEYSTVCLGPLRLMNMPARRSEQTKTYSTVGLQIEAALSNQETVIRFV